MPRKSQQSNNKPPRRQRRPRKTSVPSSLRSIASAIHRFTRRASVTMPISFGNTTAFGWNNAGTDSLQLSVSMKEFHTDTGGSTITTTFPGYTDFTALFDEWMIESVRYSMYWNNNQHNSSGTNGLPVLVFVEDPTDTLPLGSIGEAFQYSNAQVKQLGNVRAEDPGLHFDSSPKFALTTNSGGTSVLSTGWVNSLYPETVWRGVKVWFNNTGTPTSVDAGEVTIVATVRFACRIPR